MDAIGTQEVGFTSESLEASRSLVYSSSYSVGLVGTMGFNELTLQVDRGGSRTCI